MIEQALVELLVGAEGLASGPRVYPLVLPQNPTLPALVYQELRSVALAAADGDTGKRESRFQLGYWGASFASVKVGRNVLVGLLSGYAGGAIRRIEVGGMHDDYDPETGWWRQVMEIEVLWVEGE